MIYDTIIVGGGIAGLSAAYRLRDRNILVLEASDRPGGRICSETDDGGVLNFGAHMFGGPGSIVGDLCLELGLRLRPIKVALLGIDYRGYRRYKGRVETLPFVLPLPIAARLSLIKAGLALRVGSLRSLAATKSLPTDDWAASTLRSLSFEDNRTLAELIGPLHPDTDLILRAITERCGGDPREISAGHAMRSFANVWAASSPGYNLEGGSSGLPQAMVTAIGSKIRFGAKVCHVEDMDGEVRVTINGPGGVQALQTRTCILATPAFVTRKIAPNLPSETLSALDQIRYGAFLSVSANTHETQAMPWDRTYAISTPQRAMGVMFNQATDRFGTGGHKQAGSLMMFAGAERAARLMTLTDDEIIERFDRDLRSMFPEIAPIISRLRVKRWENGAPYAWPGRAALQADLTRSLGRIALAGDYLEFPNMEAAMRSGNEAARRVALTLSETEVAVSAV